jgi:hypothetical protein
LVMIVCWDKDSAFTKPEHSTYEIDASIGQLICYWNLLTND